MFAILGMALFGLIVGFIARAILPGRDRMSWPLTIVLGIVGAIVGGWLGRMLGWYYPGEAAGFVMATVGAVIVLAIYNRLVSRRRSIL